MVERRDRYVADTEEETSGLKFQLRSGPVAVAVAAAATICKDLHVAVRWRVNKR